MLAFALQPPEDARHKLLLQPVGILHVADHILHAVHHADDGHARDLVQRVEQLAVDGLLMREPVVMRVARLEKKPGLPSLTLMIQLFSIAA